MTRLIVVFALLTILVAGCAGPDYEAQRRREAFRVPKYKGVPEPSVNRLGDLWSKGDMCHYSAVASTDPQEKRRLLREAIDWYEKVIYELQALRAREKDARKREELDLLILKAREDINNSHRMIPN
jgi:hypothetical protein